MVSINDSPAGPNNHWSKCIVSPNSKQPHLPGHSELAGGQGDVAFIRGWLTPMPQGNFSLLPSPLYTVSMSLLCIAMSHMCKINTSSQHAEHELCMQNVTSQLTSKCTWGSFRLAGGGGG